MKQLIIMNIKPILFFSLLFIIGYAFGGRIGVGVAATIILLIQFII